MVKVVREKRLWFFVALILVAGFVLSTYETSLTGWQLKKVGREQHAAHDIPVSWYKLNDRAGTTTFTDQRNMNPGSCSGSQCPVKSGGINGGAFSFDGNDDFIQVGTNKWNVNKGSISLWVNVNSFPTGHHFFFGHTTQPAYGNRIQLYTNNNNFLSLGLGDNHFLSTNIAPLQTNTWHHLVLTWNNGNYQVFVDSALVDVGTYTGLNILHSFAEVGNNANVALLESFDGSIDDVRIYRHPLTNNQVYSLYTTFVGVCGDNKCDTNENPCTCPNDCSVAVCGDSCITPPETCEQNNDCTSGEYCSNCQCQNLCGNTQCDVGETPCNCPQDCTTAVCGDGCVTPPEECEQNNDCPNPEDICLGDCTCTAGGGGGSITADLIATRTNGVGPLGVVFDAVGTTHSNPSIRTFHDLKYVWDFGDPTSGVWSTSGKSKNKAIGAIAAHVYENPGTYQVTLTVTDNLGNTDIQQTTITVTDPETVYAGSTFCYSGVGDFTGCPQGATQVTDSNFDNAMNTLFASDGPRRVLFHRGETFSTTGFFAQARTGPLEAGAFGSCSNPNGRGICDNDPIIATQGSTTIIDNGGTSNFRMVNIVLSGNGFSGTIGLAPGGDEGLYARLSFVNLRSGISLSIWPQTESADNNVIYDSAFYNNDHGPGGVEHEYGAFYAHGNNVAFLGNTFDGIHPKITGWPSSHAIRPYTNKGIFSNNIFRDTQTHHIKLSVSPNGDYGQFNIISDNLFPEPSMAWASLSLGPENNFNMFEKVAEDIIVERNLWYLPTERHIVFHSRGANDVTIRNNIFFDIDNTISYFEAGTADTSTWNDWHFVNNLFYFLSGNTNEFTLLQENLDMLVGMENFVVRNNIFFGDSSSVVSRMLKTVLTPLSEITTSNNMYYLPNVNNRFDILGTQYTLSQWQAQGKGVNSFEWDGVTPIWVDPNNEDFHLVTGSPAIDVGYPLPSVFEDITGLSRPQQTTWDIGAYEQP